MDYSYNPYQTQDLRYPSEFQEEVASYVLTGSDIGSQKKKPIDSPFQRQVDFWFMAVCLGANEIEIPPVKRDRTRKFNDGTVLSTDPWRINLISLIALGKTQDATILENPGKVIQLMNDLASAGIPILLGMLRNNQQEALWSLSEYISKLMKE